MFSVIAPPLKETTYSPARSYKSSSLSVLSILRNPRPEAGTNRTPMSRTARMAARFSSETDLSEFNRVSSKSLTMILYIVPARHVSRKNERSMRFPSLQRRSSE